MLRGLAADSREAATTEARVRASLPVLKPWVASGCGVSLTTGSTGCPWGVAATHTGSWRIGDEVGAAEGN